MARLLFQTFQVSRHEGLSSNFNGLQLKITFRQNGEIDMKIERLLIPNGPIKIPSAVISAEPARGAAVIVHGYGGSKEEQLGLAWRIAEIGITAITVDLRGHGEHPLPMDDLVLSDVEAAIEYGKQFGKVTAIGHSLGGRLALLSRSDYTIAVSPALNQVFSETTCKIIENMRRYRVRESYPGINFELLKSLPTWYPESNSKTLVLYGTRDVPEIIRTCQELKPLGVRVVDVDQGLHGDTFLLEASIDCIKDRLQDWYK